MHNYIFGLVIMINCLVLFTLHKLLTLLLLTLLTLLHITLLKDLRTIYRHFVLTGKRKKKERSKLIGTL